MQCGVACLQMICEYYKKPYSKDYLSQLCFASAEGASLLSICDAAKALEIEVSSGKTSIERLRHIASPCIIHWNQNHFVVLYRVKMWGKRIYYYVADPGKGRMKYTEAEFKSHWVSTRSQDYIETQGVVLLLKPTPAFYKKMVDTSHRKHPFRFLFKYAKSYKRGLIKIVLCLLVGSVLQLLLPFLTQAIVDVGIKQQDINFIYLILLGQLMLSFSRTIVDFIRRQILLNISMRINISLVSDFFIKLLKLPMSFFDTRLTGDLLQRMNDHERVEQFLTTQALNMMFSMVSFVVFGAVLYSYSWLIFAVFLVGSICYALWITLFLRRRKQMDYLYFEAQSKNRSKTYQFLTAMQEIKLQDCEQRRCEEWEDIQYELFDINQKNLKIKLWQEAGSLFINEIKNMVITVIAATSVIHGDMTLGMMLAVQYIIGQLNVPIEQLMNFVYSLQDVRISLERINEIHEKKNEEDNNTVLTHYHDTNKNLSFSEVGFKYDPHSLNWTLNKIGCTIPEGKVTAIVGASGSGKTTLIKLLLAYYKPKVGDITIGGTSLARYNAKWWRQQCGIVMQDGVIFSESIARNIAVGDGEIDEKRMREAARIANINEYIMQLPLKYNTLIGQDGIELSQGQKQRILIARAVYKDPDYIFLDEATNALDANNERIIVENLNEFYQGRTVVIVAHRLSTVKHADQIIVLEKGHIIEIGNHKELTVKKGAYYQLVKNQLELGG
jgi:ATP-binding cassette subfamily B protein